MNTTIALQEITLDSNIPIVVGAILSVLTVILLAARLAIANYFEERKRRFDAEMQERMTDITLLESNAEKLITVLVRLESLHEQIDTLPNVQDFLTIKTELRSVCDDLKVFRNLSIVGKPPKTAKQRRM